MNKTEFHCHTSNSHDCLISLRERLSTYSKLGFSHLCITDHDCVLSNSDWNLLAGQYHGLSVIPGIEVSTLVGHVILLNCRVKPLFNSLAYLVLISKIRNYEIYLPHPVKKGTGLLREYSSIGIPHWYVRWFLMQIKYLEISNPRDKLRDPVCIDVKMFEILKSKTFVTASDSHFSDDIDINGCDRMGLSNNDPKVELFFEKKIIASEVVSVFKFRAIARYVKSSILYLIKR